jgi:hypothetical protein
MPRKAYTSTYLVDHQPLLLVVTLNGFLVILLLFILVIITFGDSGKIARLDLLIVLVLFLVVVGWQKDERVSALIAGLGI